MKQEFSHFELISYRVREDDEEGWDIQTVTFAYELGIPSIRILKKFTQKYSFQRVKRGCGQKPYPEHVSGCFRDADCWDRLAETFGAPRYQGEEKGADIDAVPLFRRNFYQKCVVAFCDVMKAVDQCIDGVVQCVKENMGTTDLKGKMDLLAPEEK